MNTNPFKPEDKIFIEQSKLIPLAFGDMTTILKLLHDLELRLQKCNCGSCQMQQIGVRGFGMILANKFKEAGASMEDLQKTTDIIQAASDKELNKRTSQN
jgi:hypothetical protein